MSVSASPRGIRRLCAGVLGLCLFVACPGCAERVDTLWRLVHSELSGEEYVSPRGQACLDAAEDLLDALEVGDEDAIVELFSPEARAGSDDLDGRARELVEKRRMEAKEEMFKSYQKVTLDNLFDQISEGEMKELDLIILIMTPTTSTLPYLAFTYQNGNSPQASNCVAIVMFSIALTLVLNPLTDIAA